MTRALFLFLAAVTVVAQPGQSEKGLIQRFQAAVSADLGGATMQQVREWSAVRPENLLEWKLADGTYVTIRYYTVEPGKARIAFETDMAKISVGSRPISGFGEQSHMVSDSDLDGYRMLVFRRGNVIVEVAAIGEQTVKRLAGLLVAEVQKEMERRRLNRE